jgi:hypothetical protein
MPSREPSPAENFDMRDVIILRGQQCSGTNGTLRWPVSLLKLADVTPENPFTYFKNPDGT